MDSILCLRLLLHTNQKIEIFEKVLLKILKFSILYENNENFKWRKREMGRVNKKLKELRSYFDLVDKDKRQFAYDTIDEYLFFSERINQLKKLPYIRVNSKNPEKQMLTPSAKLIKEYSNIIDSKRKILLMILYRVENSAADELLEKLKEFE